MSIAFLPTKPRPAASAIARSSSGAVSTQARQASGRSMSGARSGTFVVRLTACHEGYCGDGLDDDHDGLVDCCDADCIDAMAWESFCPAYGGPYDEEVCDDYVDDMDCDGPNDCDDPDCAGRDGGP